MEAAGSAAATVARAETAEWAAMEAAEMVEMAARGTTEGGGARRPLARVREHDQRESSCRRQAFPSRGVKPLLSDGKQPFARFSLWGGKQTNVSLDKVL